ncbi:glycosyltransferase [Candidatus Puniceispirillum sp.]|nr:glycosyltransferase [Candidatus Puniceispirillum sp.]
MPRAIVSVIIPTYNQADYLSEALNSLLSQSFKLWEAFVVDNYSDDHTATVLASFNDSRIKTIQYSNNGIIAASRNIALKMSKAPFIAFLDSDDTWTSEKLSKCLKILGEGFDLVCHGEAWVENGSKTRHVLYGPATLATYEKLLFSRNCISTSAVVLSRDFLKKVGLFCESKEFVTAEDYDLWLRLARGGAKITFLNEILGEYRVHSDSNSAKPLRNMRAIQAVFQHHLLTMSLKPSWWHVRRRSSLIYYEGARSLQKNGNFSRAYYYFFKSVISFPFCARCWVGLCSNLFKFNY